jgi:hypothetical protein
MGEGVLEGNDMVTRLHVGDTLTNGLNDTGALMAQNDREGSLGVLAGKCVGICLTRSVHCIL